MHRAQSALLSPCSFPSALVHERSAPADHVSRARPPACAPRIIAETLHATIPRYARSPAHKGGKVPEILQEPASRTRHGRSCTQNHQIRVRNTHANPWRIRAIRHKAELLITPSAAMARRWAARRLRHTPAPPSQQSPYADLPLVLRHRARIGRTHPSWVCDRS